MTTVIITSIGKNIKNKVEDEISKLYLAKEYSAEIWTQTAIVPKEMDQKVLCACSHIQPHWPHYHCVSDDTFSSVNTNILNNFK